jgi:voltage-gated potassium channel Kch
VAARLQEAVENVHVLSMADVVAPAFAGPCLGRELLSLVRGPSGTEGVRVVDGQPRRVPATWTTPTLARRLAANVEALAHPFDASARILIAGIAGVLTVFVAETLVTIFVEHFSVADAVYQVAKVTVTAGPNRAAELAGNWFKLLSATLMLVSLGLIAVLTAGLVNRLLDPRLTGIVGRSAVPRRDHVVVVGLGQVGLRLCGLLRELGVPVVAVEQNPDANNVPPGKDQGLPIVVGSGSSQRLLRRVSIHRARALAAVTSDEVENIAVAVAARSERDDLRLTFRAGDGDLTSDTRSLFKVGVVRDVYRIAGTALAAAALGYDAREAFSHEGTQYLVDGRGDIEAFAPCGPSGAASAVG